MQQAGLGHWFGAFVNGSPGPHGELLVADCGLFRDGFGARALGRFQHVETHPAWRRRGLCSALIHAVCRFGFEHMGLHTLVIAADPTDVAIGLYEALGFQRVASTWQLERRPQVLAV
jgi:RimJ/RimL family protein N-acetyltransferase